MQFSLWALRLADAWPLYYAANCTYGVSFIVSMLNLQFYGKENQGKRLWRLEFLWLVVRFPGKAICTIQITYTQAYFTSLKHSPKSTCLCNFRECSLAAASSFWYYHYKAWGWLQNDANRLHSFFCINYLLLCLLLYIWTIIIIRVLTIIFAPLMLTFVS